MKAKTLLLALVSIVFLAPTNVVNAQFLKKLGKKAEKAAQRGVERTVERKVQQKAEDGTEKAIEGVFGVPKKVLEKNKQEQADSISLEGVWYYEKLEGLPGFENLNDCGKKSNITYSGNTYHTQFYDNKCNLLSDSGGTYELEGMVMTVAAQAQDEFSSTKITTTQTILEFTHTKLVIQDDLTGAVVTLIKKE